MQFESSRVVAGGIVVATDLLGWAPLAVARLACVAKAVFGDTSRKLVVGDELRRAGRRHWGRLSRQKLNDGRLALLRASDLLRVAANSSSLVACFLLMDSTPSLYGFVHGKVGSRRSPSSPALLPVGEKGAALRSARCGRSRFQRAAAVDGDCGVIAA